MRRRIEQVEVKATMVLEPRVDESTDGLEQASRALRLSETRLRGMFDSPTHAILTADEAQTIATANPTAAKMFSCTIDDLIGAPLERLVPERYRDGCQIDVMGLRANGEEFPIDASISHLTVDGQRLYTVILRDISELRPAQAALVESRADMQRLTDAQDRAQENERKRIARELHDDLLQTLAAIRIKLCGIRKWLVANPAGLAVVLAEVDGLVSTAIASTRRIIHDLRSQMLDDLGFVPALESLVKLHGGTIEVGSDSRKGSTFTLRLPAVEKP